MIVIISDLHFEEEASDVIPGRGERPDVIFRRNLNPRAYRSFIAQMAEQVSRRKVKEYRLVIAGDLFDFSRTTLWFADELRPYVSLAEVNEQLEQKTLRILEAIAKEPNVKEALEVFQLLAKGRYRMAETADSKERDFPVDRIEIVYFLGNHDRLSNATPAIRQRVRELLGLSGSAEFPHYFRADDPAVLIRHGHEYGNNNFAIDLEQSASIPLELPERGYSDANFGDYITIDVAVRLPYLFRRKFGDQAIVDDPVAAKLYERLLEFDDVRPQSALFDYVLDDAAGDYSAEEAWEPARAGHSRHFGRDSRPKILSLLAAAKSQAVGASRTGSRARTAEAGRLTQSALAGSGAENRALHDGRRHGTSRAYGTTREVATGERGSTGHCGPYAPTTAVLDWF
jgi:UDP-2,3-diacylglucosamine pyrophosphatase LpxH